jgi:transposase
VGYPASLKLFTKLQQRSTLHFLQAFPTPQAAQAATTAQIRGVLKKAGHPTAEKVAPKISKALHQPHLAADAITTSTKARMTLVLVGQLQPLVEQIAAYDKDIEVLFLTHADSRIFKSLPRAGKRLAPRLLAELGDDRDRYQDARSLQALAGTAPVLYQSGTYQKAHRRSAELSPLRNALYLFAWQSTKSEPWALEYYQRAEGKSHSVAVRALSNQWVRIIYAMWISRSPYQRATFEAARQLHAPKAA